MMGTGLVVVHVTLHLFFGDPGPWKWVRAAWGLGWPTESHQSFLPPNTEAYPVCAGHRFLSDKKR